MSEKVRWKNIIIWNLKGINPKKKILSTIFFRIGINMNRVFCVLSVVLFIRLGGSTLHISDIVPSFWQTNYKVKRKSET